jgi:transposase
MSANEEKQGWKGRRRYDENYKRHAVELTLRGDRTAAAVARELGISDSVLSQWRGQYSPHGGPPGTAPQSLEEATHEIARLRAELVRMQQREGILKKSLGILSEPPRSGMPKSPE